MSSAPVGVFISTSTPPETIGPQAKRVEELGFNEVWVAEDYFCYGGFTATTLALAATERVHVGLGIIAAVARHPAVTAMEIATIARAFPGRFTAGIGHGVPAWTDQMALTTKSPLSALEECVTSIRRLLAGETVTEHGKNFTFNDVVLAHPPLTQPALVTGVLGPKSLRLSGRIADGTVMSVLAGTKYLESATGFINEGVGERGTEHSVPTFALFNVASDSASAKKPVRVALANYLTAVGPHNPLTGAFGFNDQLAELLTLGGDALAEEIPEEWVDVLTVSGTPDEVTARIRALLEAGATSVILSPVDTANADEKLAIVSELVLPQLG